LKWVSLLDLRAEVGRLSPTGCEGRPPLDRIAILTQDGDCLHITALIASRFKIMDVLAELLRQGIDLVN
jgi:hypothetical protein